MNFAKIIKKIGIISIIVFLTLTLSSCMKKDQIVENNNKVIENNDKVVKDNDKVLVHYLGKFENGEKFDSSYDRGSPLEFTVGGGGVITGFDEGVKGMKVGEKKTITLAPADAYGERDETAIEVIPRSDLAEFESMGVILEKGQTLPTMVGNFKIIDANEETVTIDKNHEMVGKTLIFDLELVEIKDK